MTKSKTSPPPGEPSEVQGFVEEVEEQEDSFELSIRIHNPLNRAIHYISDVRAMIFDPATNRLRVQLSDQGRETPPGGIGMLPHFRMVDPNSDTSIKVRLPKTILKLSSAPSPNGEVQFEEHAVADAAEISFEIGWADTPYYPDPRDKSRGGLPASLWEQQSLRISYTVPPKEKSQPAKK